MSTVFTQNPSFTYQQGDLLPPAQTRRVFVDDLDTGQEYLGPLNPQVSADASWIKAVLVNPVTPLDISVRIDPQGLAAGTYSGNFILTHPDCDNSPFPTPVALTVQPSVTPPMTDTTGPSVQIVTPQPNQMVSGVVPIEVTASDPSGIENGNVTIDGARLGVIVPTAPTTSISKTFQWDTTKVPDGVHQIAAKFFDLAVPSNSATAALSVTVQNQVVVPPPVVIPPPTPPIVLPVVTILSPGVKTLKDVTIAATAIGQNQITYMEIWISGQLRFSQSGASIAWAWNVSSLKPQTVPVEIRAIDTSGNIGLAKLGVTVQ